MYKLLIVVTKPRQVKVRLAQVYGFPKIVWGLTLGHYLKWFKWYNYGSWSLPVRGIKLRLGRGKIYFCPSGWTRILHPFVCELKSPLFFLRRVLSLLQTLRSLHLHGRCNTKYHLLHTISGRGFWWRHWEDNSSWVRGNRTSVLWQ